MNNEELERIYKENSRKELSHCYKILRESILWSVFCVLGLILLYAFV